MAISRKRTLIGVGEFQYKNTSGGDAATRYARKTFALSIERAVPEVLDSLRADLLPLEVAGACSDAEVTQWAERWRLTHLGGVPSWVHDLVRGTLKAWADFPAFGLHWDRNVFRIGGWDAVSDVEGEIRLGVVTEWSPVNETRMAARARILDGFARQLDARLEDIEALAASRVGRTPGKNDPSHFDYAALVVCAGLTHSEVARRFSGQSPDAVRERVSEVLKMVGLQRRGGRPKRN
jgi:hypothetical protein